MTATAETGKDRQRRRTREAIVSAAQRLLQAGGEPSVNDIADAAQVSRRTVYLHFPTLEQLLLDATVGLLSQQAVDEAIDAVDAGPAGAAAVERVEAMVCALADQAATTLPLGRTLIRLTVAGTGAPGTPQRGYRRVGWIERALEPVRPALEDDAFQRLVSALALVVGWEALVVLQDVRGLDAGQQLETARWAARALITAALDEPT